MDKVVTFAKSDFGKFFTRLRAFGTVQAPVRVTDQSFAFKPVESVRSIAFEALRTILPPKKFLYPQHETLIRYEGEQILECEPPLEPTVLLGVRPCDLAGFRVMDAIFLAPPGDSHYANRRSQILVVGLSCMPDKHCFCKSMGTDQPDSSYDIFLTDIGSAYVVQIHTALGGSIFEGADFVLPFSTEDKQAHKTFWKTRDESFTNGFATTNLPLLMDMESDNPVWEELGERCLSCGNCTPVCPTCYCFDVVDIAQLNGQSGERRREWDSCQFVGFAKVAGDYNFRPGPVDRLKFWYRHKLHGFADPYGFPTCVGCGRCTVSCPAGIDDIVGTVLRLEGNTVRLNEEAVSA